MTSSATSSAEPAAAEASVGTVEVLKPVRTTEAAGPTTGPLPSYAGYLFAIGVPLAIYLLSVWRRGFTGTSCPR